MLFNNTPKQYLIIECRLVTGNTEYFYIENLPANNLDYLDRNKLPLRCYKIEKLYSSDTIFIIDKLDKTKIINLHLNNSLSYSNVTKKIILMTSSEYEQQFDGLIDENSYQDKDLKKKQLKNNHSELTKKIGRFSKFINFIKQIFRK